MPIQQGDLYWVNLGEPVSSGPGYLRPCVVVQNNVITQLLTVDRNALGEKVTTLSSRLTAQILRGIFVLLEPRDI